MTEDEFKTWSSANGIPDTAVSTILQVAKIPLKKKTVRTDCIFAPKDIIELYETDGYRVNPQLSGFVFIGCTPNGDPIAIDVADDCGSVWFVDHENMHANDLRRCAVRIADDVVSAYHSISTDRTFPIDFYSAKKRQMPKAEPLNGN